MTVKELINRIYFEAQLHGLVKNKTEFAEKLGVTLDTASKGLRGLDGFATQSLANRARTAFPDIAAQVDAMEHPVAVHFGDRNNQSFNNYGGVGNVAGSADTVVNIGSNVGSTVNSHNTTGTSGKVHELEVRMAALKAENESLKIRIEEKDNLIKMLIGTKQ